MKRRLPVAKRKHHYANLVACTHGQPETSRTLRLHPDDPAVLQNFRTSGESTLRTRGLCKVWTVSVQRRRQYRWIAHHQLRIEFGRFAVMRLWKSRGRSQGMSRFLSSHIVPWLLSIMNTANELSRIRKR